MSTVIDYEKVKNKIFNIREQRVIIDSDIAELYGVETKRINEAVKNNPEKFPDNYILELSKNEWEMVRSKFSTSPLGGGKVRAPKAFTEKGLYMLATILKSPKATSTTLLIIDTFSKIREAGRIISQIPTAKENSLEHKKLLQHAGKIISDLVIPDSLETGETEASVEVNFAVVKFKYSIKKKSKK